MLIPLNVTAQTGFMDRGGTTALEKGHFQFNLGSGYTNWGLPFYGGAEYAFNEDITLGGFVSYSTYNENWFGLSWNHQVLSTFGSINMHVNRLLQFEENVDLYGGVSLGFNSITTKAKDNSNPLISYSGSRGSGMHISIQAGARYFFANNLGVQGQLFVGSFYGIHAGLTYRLQ